MEHDGPDQIVTFYSYQGGTGRTMAVANIAWILAASGKNVLTVDWDLAAPGMHRFLEPFLDAGSVMRNSGVVDILREFEDRIVHDAGFADEKVRRLAVVDHHTTTLEWSFPGSGRLSLLSAGRQNANYSPMLGEGQWSRFFDELNGADFLENLRDSMRASYDYTLIDCRAGRSDMVDMCTQHLPDVLVACYGMSGRSIDGAVQAAHAVEAVARPGGSGGAIRVLPLAMQVDDRYKARAEAGRRLAEQAFAGWPRGMTDAERHNYFASVEIPYRGDYAFEEMLAIFGDTPGDPRSLLAAYERLTDVITSGRVSSLPPMSLDDRLRVLPQFDRSARLKQAKAQDARRYRHDLS